MPYQTAKVIAEQLEKNFKIARHNDLGYLTHHPANLGSGMRASVMIYLPALTKRGRMKEKILEITKKIRNKITVRGVYGEGSSAESCIFQISNQNSIFMTDDEILSLVSSAVYDISLAEFKEQQEWYKIQRDEIANEVFKAWGVLTNALMLDSRETAEYLVWIKLGVCLGILNFKSNKIIDDLFFVTKPNTLATQLKIAITDYKERDKERANKVRVILLSSRV
jgi:protein arginine kinase